MSVEFLKDKMGMNHMSGPSGDNSLEEQIFNT